MFPHEPSPGSFLTYLLFKIFGDVPGRPLFKTLHFRCKGSEGPRGCTAAGTRWVRNWNLCMLVYSLWAFQVAPVGKNHLPEQETRERQVWSLGWEDWLKGAGQPTPVFLPGESHRKRSLVGSSSQGCKELDTTEVTEYSTHLLATLIKLWFCIVLMAVWSGLGKR